MALNTIEYASKLQTGLNQKALIRMRITIIVMNVKVMVMIIRKMKMVT